MKREWKLGITIAVIVALMLVPMVLADDVSNNLDPSVDVIAEVMPLTLGGPNGTTQLYVIPGDDDGKPGCNLTGNTTLVVSITSSNTSVATVAPSSATFTSCGSTPILTITPHSVGSATITVSETSNTTGRTFNFAPATFTVNVSGPPNTAPSILITGVTGGASYNKGFVPAATCEVTDAEDGNSSFTADLSIITGPYAGDGIGLQTASCSYTDDGELTASASETYSIIDPSLPSISYVLTPEEPDGVNGWYKSDVSLDWTIAENESPSSLVLTGCDDQNITVDQLEQSYSCSATSAGGSAGPVEIAIKRDATPPVLSLPGNITTEATSTSGSSVNYTATASDLKSGSGAVLCAPASGSTFPIGTTTISCSAMDAAGNTANGSFAVTVNKLNQTVTFGAIADKTYGDADFSVSATASSGLPVNFAASGTCIVTGNTVSISGAGLCTITASQEGNDSYSAAADVAQPFTIDPKTASVTPNAANKTYGETDPALSGTLTGFLPADNVTATYSRTSGETVAGGPYVISAALSPAGVLSNYDIAYNTAPFTINQKAASVTPDAASKTYGEVDPTLTGTLTGFIEADGVTAIYNRTSGETVAGNPYVISAVLSPAGVLGNYAITYNTANFTIDQKPASVTPNAASKIYGEPDPALTGTLDGFLAADNVTATYSRASGETVAGGPYSISAVLSPGGVLGNYAITYNTADFTINPKAASVTPTAASKTYGEADPALTGTLVGFLAADNVAASYSRALGETVAGNPYVISAVLSPAGVLGNYAITYNTANFTIDPKAASVTPDAAGKVLGSSDPALTGTLVGFLPTDGVTATYSRVAGETVAGNPYVISAVLSPAGVLGNYAITYNTANFTITYASSGTCYGAPGHAILQPINADGTSVFKKGSTVPAKFRVCDANGNSIGTPGVVTNFRLIQTQAGIVIATVNEPVDSTTPDVSFRWSASDQQWIFNINTKNSTANKTYTYRITLNDGSTIDFSFGLK